MAGLWAHGGGDQTEATSSASGRRTLGRRGERWPRRAAGEHNLSPCVRGWHALPHYSLPPPLPHVVRHRRRLQTSQPSLRADIPSLPKPALADLSLPPPRQTTSPLPTLTTPPPSPQATSASRAWLSSSQPPFTTISARCSTFQTSTSLPRSWTASPSRREGAAPPLPLTSLPHAAQPTRTRSHPRPSGSSLRRWKAPRPLLPSAGAEQDRGWAGQRSRHRSSCAPSCPAPNLCDPTSLLHRCDPLTLEAAQWPAHSPASFQRPPCHDALALPRSCVTLTTLSPPSAAVQR